VALDLSGTVEPAATRSRRISRSGKALNCPEDSSAALVSHGELALTVRPTCSPPRVAGARPADALADIDIDIAGTPQAITLNTVRLRQASGDSTRPA
jgi:hypothetical protein